MRKRSFTTGVCLIAFALLVSPASAANATVSTAVTAASGTCPAIPASKTSFLTTDPLVWMDFAYSGGNAGDGYQVQWIEPNGTTYATGKFTQAATGGSYCGDWSIPIAGNTPATLPGNWSVKLVWNGTLLVTKQFTISAPPSSPLSLSATNVSVVIDTSATVSPSTVSVTLGGAPAAFQTSTATYDLNRNAVPNWLVLTETGTGSLSISVQRALIQQGTSLIYVSVAGASNNPQIITVTPSCFGIPDAIVVYGYCEVQEPASGGDLPSPSISSTQIALSPASPSAVLSVTDTSKKANHTWAAVTYAPGDPQGWLTVPATSAPNGNITISAATGNLSVGNYLAWIDFNFACTTGNDSCSTASTAVVVTFAVTTASVTPGPAPPIATNASISKLNPSSVAAGSGSFTLEIDGANFVSGATVRWNSTSLNTTFVSATQLNAAVSASLVASTGTVSITVLNSGSSVSNATQFSVVAAAPSITSLNPQSARVGSPNQQVTISGSGFVSGSVAQWNGSSRSTTFNSSTQLVMQVLASDLLSAGTAQVTVFNPGTGTSSEAPFTISAASTSGLQFLPATPCRILDTRNANGTFGGPYLSPGSTRTVPIPSGACTIPAGAQAYSLNFTALPRTSKLGSLFVWPTGQAMPVATTLTSPDGQVLADAYLVEAGTNGAINVSTTDAADMIIDVNGFFVPPASTTLQFYPLSPCRVLDTRNANGVFGGPSLLAGEGRSFPLPSSACNVPANAEAYSLNVTVVPQSYLGFLTVYPTGQNLPNVSTMNSWDGSVLANAAIVPAGAGGALSFYSSNTADFLVDINGYFGPRGAGGLNFYPLSPCRLVDTRGSNGQLGGPIMPGVTTRTFPLTSGGCGIPAYPAAQAYSLTMTVFPQGYLGYLSTWPAGGNQPIVSTLNTWKGTAVSNLAIVPAGTNGSVNVFVTQTTNVTIDTTGYFGP